MPSRLRTQYPADQHLHGVEVAERDQHVRVGGGFDERAAGRPGQHDQETAGGGDARGGRLDPGLVHAARSERSASLGQDVEIDEISGAGIRWRPIAGVHAVEVGDLVAARCARVGEQVDRRRVTSGSRRRGQDEPAQVGEPPQRVVVLRGPDVVVQIRPERHLVESDRPSRGPGTGPGAEPMASPPSTLTRSPNIVTLSM